MMTIDELDEKFCLEGELGFTETDGDLIAISVFNKYADAEICLYGGHVTRFTPHGSFETLWVSPESNFEVGKPIRGGIPVCFPWFGPDVNGGPLHGFARLMYWDVLETASVETGETRVKLQLTSSPETKNYWPYDFAAVLTIVVGRSLDVSLSVQNTGEQSFEYTAAFHSYFNISGIENIRIGGLQGASYYNGSERELLCQEEELLAFEKEENRRYVNTVNDCLIIDKPFNQVIRVAKRGSNVTVVWNPGEETTKAIGDIPDHGYQEFVCVEAVNAYDDVVKLAPGEEHTTATVISLDVKASSLRMGDNDGGFSVI